MQSHSQGRSQRITRVRPPFFVALCLLVSGAVGAPETTVLTSAQARPFASIARGLAKGGHGEGLDLARLIAKYGPEKSSARLVAECEKSLRKAKKKSKLTASTARGVERAVRSVARQLEGAPQKQELARFLLGVDADCEAAHKALGHERHEGRWHEPAMIPLLKRRVAIADMLRRARSLPVEMTESASEIKLIEIVHRRPGRKVSWGSMHIHSADVSLAKMRRTLKSIVQAAAVWNGLVKDGSKPEARRRDWVMTATRPIYKKWKDVSLERRHIDREDFEFIKDFDCFDVLTYSVAAPGAGAGTESFFIYDLLCRPLPDGWSRSLFGGQLNFVCFGFLGTPMPTLYDRSTLTRVVRKTQSTPRSTIERKKHEAMANAQLTGMKRWMAYLARRGEDPQWWTTHHPRLADFARDELLKSTIVAAYLNEKDAFGALWKRLSCKGTSPRANKDVVAKALGQTHLALEQDWRKWLFASYEPGILQRLGQAGPGKRAPVLAYLDALRLRAIPGSQDGWLTPLALDPELSDGCRRHAEYLRKNPEQQSQWPEAHEEFADKPGFSVEGLRAGTNSVIAFQQENAKGAVDEWLATFYHRLPLLDPGLQRIGWGLKEGIAVLDSSSLVDPDSIVSIACYPPPGEKNVRRSFAPELPNPVPGEDQTKWGYPITLQVFGLPAEHDPKLVLHEDTAGPVVACHVSVPGRPTNPELDPRDTYCLIPKQKLKANTRYVVAGTHPQTGKRFNWYFVTGK